MSKKKKTPKRSKVEQTEIIDFVEKWKRDNFELLVAKGWIDKNGNPTSDF